MIKKLTALCLALCLFQNAFADTFIVTSNADSGPGTLREAIQKANANGVVDRDFIHFNIAEKEFNKRIINLVTELPALSSNITIDGTSQEGEAYGLTDAKICLKKDDYAAEFSTLKIENAVNVEVYGLFLYYGYWEGLFGNPFRSNKLYGINIVKSSNIKIGAPSKGNVLNGFVYAISSQSGACANISVQSNYIGLDSYYKNEREKEIDEVLLGVEAAIIFYNVKNISIGGSEEAMGNIMSGNRVIFIEGDLPTGNGYIKIQNNCLGKWYDKTTLSVASNDFWHPFIVIGRNGNNSDWSAGNTLDYEVEILDNDITRHLSIEGLSKPFIIKRNTTSEDYRSNRHTAKWRISNCTGGGIIGGDDEKDANIFLKKEKFTYTYPSLWIYHCGPVTILKNIFDCNSGIGSTSEIRNDNSTVPYIQIDKTRSTSTLLAGKATPNSRIDLYYDDDCSACEGKKYLATVFAGADSSWTYIGNIDRTIVATATYKDFTSMFSTPEFEDSRRIITQPTCGLNNGSITGITAKGADAFFWINHFSPNKDTVSKTLDLLNVGPGYYMLYGVHNGTCVNIYPNGIELGNRSPKIETAWTQKIEPSCGNFNGRLYNIYAYGTVNTIFKWQEGEISAISNPLSFSDLGEGEYQLIAKDTLAGCADTAKFKLINQSGPSLKLNNIIISPEKCNNKDGHIKNILPENVKGTAFIEWLDSTNKRVGNTLDLTGIPAGKYRLKFKDENTCDTIITPYYTIRNVGAITIDTSGKKLTASSCVGATGSIQNIKVVMGEQYQWKNSENAIVGTTQDIANLSPGSYQLTVTNSTGCEQISPIIVVPQAGFNEIKVLNAIVKDATCDHKNGFINPTQFSKNPSAYTFQWIDSATNATVGTSTNLSGLDKGTYILYAKDNNGCGQEIYRSPIRLISKPVFDYTHQQIVNDECNQKTGKIAKIQVAGLQGNNVTYKWTNENGEQVASTLDLKNVGAGTYQLFVNNEGCIIESVPIKVINTTQVLSDPRYDDQIIPRHSSVTLVNADIQQGIYKLYQDANALQSLQQNTNGQFPVGPVHTDALFYVQRSLGNCKSNLVKVKIQAVDETKVYVPSAFTPNNDGRNDILKPVVYGILKLEYFLIFDRWGSTVFNSTTLNNGWDGKNKSLPSPAGVYVWIIKGKDIHNKEVNLKGSFVVIR